MDVHSPEPQPWSSEWSSTPAAARWRAAQPFPPAKYVGRLAQPLSYPDFLTELRPPPSDVVPEIDADAAYNAARAYHAAPNQDDGPTILLAVADIHERVNVLVYLLRWENVRWTPSGPPRPSGHQRPPVVGLRMEVVDATTGTSLGTMLTSGGAD